MRKPPFNKRAAAATQASDRRFARSVRTPSIDGGYTVAGAPGEHYHVSAEGDVDGDIPGIRRVQVQDVTLIVRHDVTTMFQTASHTLHFVGGGVLSYWRWNHAVGITVHTKNITCCKTAEGVFIVSGTTTNNL